MWVDSLECQLSGTQVGAPHVGPGSTARLRANVNVLEAAAHYHYITDGGQYGLLLFPTNLMSVSPAGSVQWHFKTQLFLRTKPPSALHFDLHFVASVFVQQRNLEIRHLHQRLAINT